MKSQYFLGNLLLMYAVSSGSMFSMVVTPSFFIWIIWSSCAMQVMIAPSDSACKANSSMFTVSIFHFGDKSSPVRSDWSNDSNLGLVSYEDEFLSSGETRQRLAESTRALCFSNHFRPMYTSDDVSAIRNHSSLKTRPWIRRLNRHFREIFWSVLPL